MKVLLDTNVILDVWLAREPFWQDSAQLLARVEQGKLTGYVSPTTVTTLHYLGKKVLGENKARALLQSLLSFCKVTNVSTKTFLSALDSQVTDYEDAVLEAAAISNKLDLIATRNIRDFKKSTLPAKEPAQILKTLSGRKR